MLFSEFRDYRRVPLPEAFMSRKGFVLLVIVFLVGCRTEGNHGAGGEADGPERALIEVSDEGDEFAEAFNRWADQTRLVLIYAPT